MPENRGFSWRGLEFRADFLEQPVSNRRAGLSRLHRNDSRKVIDYLAEFRFTGSVEAMPEGSLFFPDEPILRWSPHRPDAQLVKAA